MRGGRDAVLYRGLYVLPLLSLRLSVICNTDTSILSIHHSLSPRPYITEACALGWTRIDTVIQ